MRSKCKAGFQSHVICNCSPDRIIDAALPVDLPDDTPVRTQHGLTTLGEVMETAPDPLREDEVEAVAKAIFQDCGGWFHERFDISGEDLEDTARAAIQRLDQVRNNA